MNLKIGEKIKSLRAKNNVTQEKLAEYLGNTAQAVSRWESAICYPDVEMIPAIANFFNVSTDDLFGFGDKTRQERFDEVKAQIDKFALRGKNAEAVKLLRETLQEFPNDYEMLNLLAHFLANQAGNDCTEEEKNIYLSESIAIQERLLRDCNEQDRKYGIYQSLAYNYDAIGDKEKAIETANKLPNMYLTNSFVLCTILDGEAQYTHIKNHIINLSDNLAQNYRFLAQTKYDNAQTPEDRAKKVALINKAIKVLEIMFEDENYGFYGERLWNKYFTLTKSYAEWGEVKNALDCLEKAADFAIKFCTADYKFEYSAIVFEREPSDNGSTTYYNSSDKSSCMYMLEEFGKPAFDCVRDEARFKAVRERLQENVDKNNR